MKHRWTLFPILLSLVLGPTIGGQPLDAPATDWIITSTASFDGVVGAMIRVTAESPADCFARSQVTTRSTGAQVSFLGIEWSSEHFFWGLTERSLSDVHASVQGFTTYSYSLANIGFGTFGIYSSGIIDDRAELFVVAKDIAPRTARNVSSQPDPSYSIRVELSCSQPVRTQIYGDRSTILLTSLYSESGVSAWTGATGGQHIANAKTDQKSSDVRFRGVVAGAQLGHLTLTHPDGTDAWSYDLNTGYIPLSIDGAEGEYELTAVRLAPNWWPIFWTFLAGFSEICHLDDLARDEPSPCHK